MPEQKPSAPFLVENADWRLAAVTTTAADIPESPGGHAFPAGSIVFASLYLAHETYSRVNIPAPHPVSIALSVAYNAAGHASRLKSEIKWDLGTNQVAVARITQATQMFDLFENCMISATFAFLAIESEANNLIRRLVKGSFSYRKKKKEFTYTKEELERAASTEDKLWLVLPRITNKADIKGTELWQNFKLLKEVRDEIVHIKSDSLPGVEIDTIWNTLYATDPHSYVKTALGVLRHFGDDDLVRRWDEVSERFYGKASTV